MYWGHTAARIVIVDGSPEPMSGAARELLTAMSHMTYVHSADTVAARMSLAARQIRTPYAVLLGDDEFLLKAGLCRAIDKLDRDPTLVACIGQSLKFYASWNGSSVTYGAGYPHWKYNITQDDLEARLTSAMATYNAATCYAVLREPCWSKSWGAIQHWSSPAATELQQAMSVYVLGKLSAVDAVYWMRSLSENAEVRTKQWDIKLSFYRWWGSPQFSAERERFVELLATEAAAAQHIGYDEARRAILKGVEAYLLLYRRTKRSFWATAKTEFRERLSKLLRAALPERALMALKTRLKLASEGELGALDVTKRAQIRGVFQLSDEAVEEISEIEALISGFHQARLAES